MKWLLFDVTYFSFTKTENMILNHFSDVLPSKVVGHVIFELFTLNIFSSIYVKEMK